MSQRMVMFMFAGRRVNMEVLMPFLDRILDERPETELHLWDLTRDPRDQRYVRSLHGEHDGRVQVIEHLHTGHPIKCMNPSGRAGRRFRCSCLKHTPPYEKPYVWYAEQGQYDGAVFVKLDDDVLFLETDRLDDLISPLANHPNRIVSANVINNVVCAKYEPALAAKYAGIYGDPADPTKDRGWWSLHCEAMFARDSHDWFLDNSARVLSGVAGKPSYVRTRPGEAISINCIAFTHATMKRLAASFHHDLRLGDEGAVDRMLPWIARSFHVAHLTFGPQDRAIPEAELNDLRNRYAALAKVYLNE